MKHGRKLIRKFYDLQRPLRYNIPTTTELAGNYIYVATVSCIIRLLRLGKKWVRHTLVTNKCCSVATETIPPLPNYSIHGFFFFVRTGGRGEVIHQQSPSNSPNWSYVVFALCTLNLPLACEPNEPEWAWPMRPYRLIPVFTGVLNVPYKSSNKRAHKQ